ncbi:MAG: hypothetical protein DRQ55_13290 [Planctomycetota bacterium]|nr:MAG: hypothetical protein DRQ55_13290 [Planctomycetota bacterium]
MQGLRPSSSGLRRPERGGVAGRLLALVLLALVAAALMLVWMPRGPDDSSARPSWQRSSRVSQLELLPIAAHDVVLLGASLIEHGEWAELLPGHSVRNRGIAGDKLADVLARMQPIVAAGPRAVFVMVGLNDVLSGVPGASIETRQRELVRRLSSGAPDTRVVLMSLLPVRRPGPAGVAANRAIAQVNAGLKRVASESGCEFMDLTPMFTDADGQLPSGYTVDGVHLTGAGYELWSRLLADCGWL